MSFLIFLHFVTLNRKCNTFGLTHEQGYGLNRSLSFNIGRINHMRINEPEGKRIFINILKDSSSRKACLLAFFPWF